MPMSEKELRELGAEEARALVPLADRRSHRIHMEQVRMKALKKQEGKR